MKVNALGKYVQFCLRLSVVVALAQLAVAQNANTGEIKGTVQDSSNAVVADAKDNFAALLLDD